MTLQSVTLRGFLRFTDAITLDVAALPAGLIAIVGENGSGKTTLLEAALAALYRAWVSRGDLAPYATGKDSFLEAVFLVEGRGTYRARVNVDGIRRTSDAVLEVTPIGGSPALLNDGKATTFDAAVRQIFPSPALLQASCFAAQNKTGDFITAKPAQRRELFAELLGLGALTTLGQTAKTIGGLIDQARGRLASAADLLGRQISGETRDHEAQAQQARVQRAEVVAEQAALRVRIEQLQAQLDTMGDAVAAHGAAAQRVLALEAELRDRHDETARLERDRRRLADTLTADRDRITTRLETRIADLDAKLQGNAQIQAMGPEIRAAAAAVTTLDAQLLEQRRELEVQRVAEAAESEALRACERHLADLHQVETLHARSADDAALLGTVPCGGDGPYAACQFLINATAARARLTDLVAQLEPKAAIADQVGQLTSQRAARQAITTSLLADIGAAERRRTSLQTTAGYLDKLHASEARVAALQVMRIDAEAQAAGDLSEAQDRHDAALGTLNDRVGVVAVRLAQVEPALVAATHERERLEAGNTEATSLQLELRSARRAWDDLTTLCARLDAALEESARAQARVAGWEQQRASLLARQARLGAELVEWQLLARAFDKTGLPELEIDAAGPTISAYTNELLEVCHGTRFSLEVVTQVARADGKGLKDDFTVRVTDNAAGGIARDIADLSGGEQVIVSEALRNAIGIYVNRRAAMPVRTCWRDETTGALDPENAGRYLQMLRKVQHLGGYTHVLFITHNVAAAAQADAQVRVADGRVAVSFPPYIETAA